VGGRQEALTSRTWSVHESLALRYRIAQKQLLERLVTPTPRDPPEEPEAGYCLAEDGDFCGL
jgi:hypothetical protein